MSIRLFESRISYKGGADKDLFSHIYLHNFSVIPACRESFLILEIHGEDSPKAFGDDSLEIAHPGYEYSVLFYFYFSTTVSPVIFVLPETFGLPVNFSVARYLSNIRNLCKA